MWIQKLYKGGGGLKTMKVTINLDDTNSCSDLIIFAEEVLKASREEYDGLDCRGNCQGCLAMFLKKVNKR